MAVRAGDWNRYREGECVVEPAVAYLWKGDSARDGDPNCIADASDEILERLTGDIGVLVEEMLTVVDTVVADSA